MANSHELDEQITLALQEGDQFTLDSCRRRLQESLLEAIATGDHVAVEDCTHSIGLLHLLEKTFSQPLFEFLMALIRRPEFLRLESADSVLLRFEHEWELLLASQKQTLLPVLEQVYPLFASFMPRFVIPEILGEYFKDASAFDVLCRLRETCSPESRELVPHGFEHLVTDSGDPKLASRAYDELLAMKADTSDAVRAEVEESLARIAAKKSVQETQ